MILMGRKRNLTELAGTSNCVAVRVAQGGQGRWGYFLAVTDAVRSNRRFMFLKGRLTDGTTFSFFTACAVVGLFLCVLAGSAAAAPRLGLDLTRTEAPFHPGDERLVYEVTVKNEAGANPVVDDELICSGTPVDGVPWGVT